MPYKDFNKPKVAFSLVEISIIILIIGILISGVSQGVDLYKDYKISIAKNLTQNSRVGRIDNLVLWLEASQKSSFEPNDIKEGLRITKWKNIAPNIPSVERALNDALATSATGPRFYEDVVNNLPSLNFDPSEDNCLWVRNGFDGLGIDTTVYFAIKTKSDWEDVNQPRLLGRISNSNLYSMWDIRSPVLVYNNGANVTNYVGLYAIKPNSLILHELIIDRGKEISYKITGNSNISGYAIDTYSGPHINAGLSIRCGGVNKASAYYLEIIVFDRALSVNERSDVRNYLIQKWGIKK
jgi:hypothetical protein